MTKHATHPHRCVACFSYMAALCNKLIKQLPCYPSSPSHSPQSQRTDNKKDAPQRKDTSIVSCGDRTRTCDLWVMSPTSYHCSTPRSFVSAKVRRISETAKRQPDLQLCKPHYKRLTPVLEMLGSVCGAVVAGLGATKSWDESFFSVPL